MGVSTPLVSANTASSSGLLPASSPKLCPLPKFKHLFDDVPLLVHLDRVHAVVVAGVAVLGARFLERARDLGNAVLKDVREAEQEWRLNAASADLIDEVFEVDGPLGVLIGVDRNVTLFVDPEVSLTPVLDAVGFERVVEFPGGVNVGGIGTATVEGLAHQRSLSRGAGSWGSGRGSTAIVPSYVACRVVQRQLVCGNRVAGYNRGASPRGEIMALALRFVAVCSVILFACAPATAQLPVAPEPHLALDELVKEYTRLGLPLPPANAELVRIKLSPDGRWEYGFRTPPAKPGAPSYLIGAKDVNSVAAVELLKPDRTATRVDEWVTSPDDLLCLTAQCHARGWKEFAEALYARIRTETSGTRADIVAKLRKWKPGTAEFFIDGLTEHSRWPDGWLRPHGYPAGDWESGEEPYLKLAELGFDAVPALLEHLGDRRFTEQRSEAPTINQMLRGATSYQICVGHIVGQLLDDFSGGWTGYQMDGGKLGDPKKAREWLAEAQKVGEEMWLADRVLPALHYNGSDKDLVEGGGTPNKAIARALGAKYPARLAEAYRTVLTKRPAVESEVLARAIVLSKLPREKKLSLLEEGLAHKELAHRAAALDALADLDAPAFHKRLIAMLKADADGNLAGFVCRTDDPACWDALTASARSGSAEYRLKIIDGMRYVMPLDQNKKTRPERLRFLVGFLNDETASDGWFNAVPGESTALQVRDLAAVALAREFGMFNKIKLDEKRGPFSRLFIRAAVANMAAEELERLKK